MNKLILMLFVFNSVTVFSQSTNEINNNRFNFLMDSLTIEKNRLVIEKGNLNTEIDSLKNLLVSLDEQCKSARINSLIKKYGREVGLRISNGQIWKGMTDKMLEESWGKPDNITKNKEKWGTFTQWYYGKITYFFRDGIMTGWEEIK